MAEGGGQDRSLGYYPCYKNIKLCYFCLQDMAEGGGQDWSLGYYPCYKNIKLCYFVYRTWQRGWSRLVARILPLLQEY